MPGSSEALLVRGGTVVVMDDVGSVVGADVRVRDGRIAEVAPGLTPEPGEVVVDATDRIVIPGFVQTHVHLCQTLFRGLADDLLLLDWLRERIWPLEGSHSASSLRASAELGIAELLLGGVTGIVDMATVRHTDEVFAALEASGMRAVAGKCMMDGPDNPEVLRDTSTEASLRESVELAERWDGAGEGRIRYAFNPRFVISCTDGLLREVAEEATARGLWVHTHASENTEELRIVRERSGGAGNLVHLARLGIRGPKLVVAHCIHLDEDDRHELVAAGSRVSHCPSSNLKLGSGICDVKGLLAQGAHVSLGPDGAPCNNRLDPFTEMRTAALLQKVKHGPDALPAAQALRMATRSGAEAIGLGDELGQIRPGYLADMVVLELDPILDGPGGDVPSRVVYAAERRSVRTVIAGGRRLVHDGELVGLDRQAIATRAATELEGCLQRAGLAR